MHHHHLPLTVPDPEGLARVLDLHAGFAVDEVFALDAERVAWLEAGLSHLAALRSGLPEWAATDRVVQAIDVLRYALVGDLLTVDQAADVDEEALDDFEVAFYAA